jgi:NCS1 family nucleobase:cation symporter-1
VLGLPTTMTCCCLLATLATSGAEALCHRATREPVRLAAKLPNPAVVILGLLTVLVATVWVNVAASVVSPSRDFSNTRERVLGGNTMRQWRDGGVHR